MKKLFTLFACLLAVGTVLAQAPDMFNYQAVARDASGNILANESINVTFIIHSGSAGGTVVFEEDHTGISTNDFGLFNLQIGNGTNVSGSIGGINWGGNSYWLEVEVNGASAGTQQLLSVPYAQYAEETGNPSPWTTSGSNVYIENNDVGIGTTDPNNDLAVFGTTTARSLVHLESSAMSASDYDILEIEAPVGATLGQFVEFQRGNSDIVGQVNTDGSAMFQSLELEQTTETPNANTAYGNSLPLAYGSFSVTLGGTVTIQTDYGIASATSSSTGVVEITLDNAFDGSPVVSVTTFNNTPFDEIATYSVIGDDTIEVNIADGTGSAVYSNFSIVVYGVAK